MMELGQVVEMEVEWHGEEELEQWFHHSSLQLLCPLLQFELQ